MHAHITHFFTGSYEIYFFKYGNRVLGRIPRRKDPDDPTQDLPFVLNYGCHAYLGDVVLGLKEVFRLVDVSRDELGTRALLGHQVLALDASLLAVKQLTYAT